MDFLSLLDVFVNSNSFGVCVCVCVCVCVYLRIFYIQNHVGMNICRNIKTLKPGTKEHLVPDYILHEVQEQETQRVVLEIKTRLTSGQGMGKQRLERGMRRFGGVMEMFYILNCMMVI